MQKQNARVQRRAQAQSEREFAVFMLLPTGVPIVETMIDIDPQRAAKAALIAAGGRGVQLVSVQSNQLFLGFCEGCGIPILSGVCHTRKADTDLIYCEACAR